MSHVVPIAAVFLLSAVVLGAWFQRWPVRERLIAWSAYLGHVAASFVMLWIIIDLYDGVGDALSYLRQGELLARYAKWDLWDHTPHIIELILQRDPSIPVPIVGSGTSTGSMAGIAGISVLLLGSIWAANLAISIAAYTGQLALFAALRRVLPTELHGRVALATLLLPSVVFWSSGVQKESMVILGLGWMILGLTEVARARFVSSALILIPSTAVIALIKPYVFFPLAAALAVWIYLRRALRRGQVRVRPVTLIAVGVSAVSALIMLGELFPSYSFANLGETAALHQYYGRAVGGGSFVEMGDPEERSMLGQFAFAPRALLASLFRPLIFEASNVTMLVSALETTFFTGLLAHAVYVLGPGALWRRLWSSPTLLAAVVFVVLLGTGVGLATTNLGSLSRYRIPMLPFFALVLLSLPYGAKRKNGRRARQLRTPAPADRA